MPRERRLTGTEIRALQVRARYNASLFSLSIATIEGKTAFTCVVSKKVSKSAVVRNTVKRRMRAAVRSKISSLEEERAYVFMAKPGAAQADYQSIAREIAQLLERAHSAPMN